MGKYWYLTDMGLHEGVNTNSPLFKSYGTIYIDNDTGILQYMGIDENNNPTIKDVSIGGFCNYLKKKSINSNGKSYFNSVDYSELNESYFWKTPDSKYHGYFTEDFFPTTGDSSVWFGNMVYSGKSSNYLSEAPSSISATLSSSILTLTISYTNLNRAKMNNANYFYAFQFHFQGDGTVGGNFFTPTVLNNFVGTRSDNWLSGIKAKVIINGAEKPEIDASSPLSTSSLHFIKCGTNGNVVIYPKGQFGSQSSDINDFDITVNSLKIILTYEIAPQNFVD